MRDGNFTIQTGSDLFAVSVSGGVAVVKKDPLVMPDLITDTGTASRILLCGIKGAEYDPNITVNNPDSDFFEMFPPKVSFFSDHF